MLLKDTKERKFWIQVKPVLINDFGYLESRKDTVFCFAEAEMQEKINYAKGEAEALLTKALARAKSVEAIGKSLESSSGKNAGSLIVAEQYVQAFQQLAKKSNTLLLPSDASNVTGMVTQVLSFVFIFKYEE